MAVRHRCGAYLLATLILSALITEAASQCGSGYNRTLRQGAGQSGYKYIVSPGYPDNYPDNARCRWLLYTSPGYVIQVHLAWIDMEQSYQCSYDALTLYDGQTAYHKKIARICTDRVKSFYSSGSYMYIEFVSDFTVSAKGFQIEYSAIRREDVPTTVQPPYPWPFPGEITTRTTTTTSSSGSRYSWPSYSVAALIGGLTGALVLLFVLFALARYYLGRHYHRGGGGRRQTARPYPPPTSSAAAPPPASTIYHNNNAAVFMVSSTANARLHPSTPSSAPPYGGGGATNLAFSPYGEAPPAYFAVQQSTTVVQPGGTVMGVSYGIPPPSYTEAMRFSHPPAPAPLHPPPPPAPPVAGQPGVQPSAAAPAAAAASSGNGEMPSVSSTAPATESASP